MFAAQHLDYALIEIGFFLLVAFPVHELAHALAAHALGDRTPQLNGRLTLNPISHFHPIGGLLLIVSVALTGMPIGFAATPVNPSNFKGRYGEALVAVAGPLSNLVTALIFGIVIRLLFGNFELLVSTPRLFNLLALITSGSVGLAIFNMLPVPPLDGSTVLLSVVSPQVRWQLQTVFAQYGMLLLLAVFVLSGYVLGPITHAVFGVIVGPAAAIFG